MSPYFAAGLTILGVSGAAALVAWASKARAATGPAATLPDLRNQILFSWKAGRNGNTELVKKSLQTAEATALALGLTKTAKAIKEGLPLPTDETWPGTNMSVSAYMKEADAAA